MKRLHLASSQRDYDAWYAERLARVNAQDDPYRQVDLNDAIFVFVTARELASTYPDKLPELVRHTPAAVERAEHDLGMFMGVSWLAQQVGIDPEDARTIGLGLLK